MRIVKRVFNMIVGTIGAVLLFIGILAVYNQMALIKEKDELVPKGQMVDLGAYRVHVYTEGECADAPTLVFLAGSATVAPVYDFKPLYSLLSGEYRIAVVEKAGYGYSDIVRVKRDVASMVEEVRVALSKAGIEGPYVLLPHSMSGLEAMYWAQNFPHEVGGIIGLDMAVPYSFEAFDFGKADQMVAWGGLFARLGLLRIPGLYSLNEASLDKAEARQQRLLMYRNAFNLDYVAERKAARENAQRVQQGGLLSCPILMFASDGAWIGGFWVPTQRRFAKENKADLEFVEGGHYLHHHKSEEMAGRIKLFLKRISP